MEAESWIVEPPLPAELFPDDPATLWSDVLERKGGQYSLIARMPADPTLNWAEHRCGSCPRLRTIVGVMETRSIRAPMAGPRALRRDIRPGASEDSDSRTPRSSPTLQTSRRSSSTSTQAPAEAGNTT